MECLNLHENSSLDYLQFRQYLEHNCILYFNPSVVGYYAIELQIEDFATASSTTPMSSVPLVFLVSVVNSGATCCAEGTNSCRKYTKFFLE